MSKRYIDTRFWHDNFVRDSLNPLDRYLFLYFLTNDKTSICGIYELPISMIANETGLEIEMIKKMLKRLKGRIYYVDGWVCIKNFIRYQNYRSPKIVAGIEKEIEKVPERIIKDIPYPYGIDTLSTIRKEKNKNIKEEKERVSFLLKDWNERQPSPIPNFKPENIINKHGLEKVEKLVKEFGSKNNGFSQFLTAIKT